MTDVWDMHDVGWAWWLLRSVGMVAFRGLAIYGVVWLTRRVSSADRAERGAARTDGLPAGGPQRRLAGGEISVDEYDSLRAVIDDPAPPAPAEAPVR